jgi:hypothetical protein
MDTFFIPITRSFLNLFFSKVSCLHETVMTDELSLICANLNNQNYDNAERLVKELKTNMTIDKLLEYISILTKQLTDDSSFTNLNFFESFISNMYRVDKQAINAFYITMDNNTALKLIELAKRTENATAVAFHVIKTILNFFKAQGSMEPVVSKKLREDLEYVDLIQMYLNGSKELPERKTDNFNYALLSEFLKKDDLRVLKSIEDYLDSAENKALGAAGAVAQSIEKEDLEPGVKKIKKDVERIEKLED